MTMGSAYRILKLNTGEEIIARIQKREKGKVCIETPMCFRTVLMSDPMTGIQKEITILKDWISYTSDNFVKIPENVIISYSSPAEEAVSLYEKEKERKTKSKKREIKNLESFQKEMKKDVDDFLNELMQQQKQHFNEEEFEEQELNNFSSVKDILDHIRSMNPDYEMEFDFEFTFPMEEVTDETTENEKNHPDYGNRWTDWSSDPNQY